MKSENGDKEFTTGGDNTDAHSGAPLRSFGYDNASTNFQFWALHVVCIDDIREIESKIFTSQENFYT